jgi:hypothetical protein
MLAAVTFRQVHPIPVRLTEDLKNHVDSFAKRMSISRSAILRLAVQQWLNAVDARGINPMLNEDGSAASLPQRSPVRKSPGKAKEEALKVSGPVLDENPRRPPAC